MNSSNSNLGRTAAYFLSAYRIRNLFRLDDFRDWYDLSSNIKKIAGVEEVVSVTRLYRLFRDDSLKLFEFVPICKDKPVTQAEVDSLKRVIYDQPFLRGPDPESVHPCNHPCSYPR